MASAKISALTEDTAPHRGLDFAPTYDASAVATKKVTLRNFGIMPLMMGFTNSNPADATNYFFGPLTGNAITGSGGFSRYYIPRTGLITAAYIFITCTVTGTAGINSTFYIRYDDTTDTTVSSVVTMSASSQAFSNTGLSIAVTAGHYIEAKILTGTWAVNPTGVYGTMLVVLD